MEPSPALPQAPDIPPPADLRTRAAADAAAVAAAALLTFLLASALELAEAFNRWLHHYERWQADELPFVLLVAALGLAWYALRRRGEARRALALHRQAQQQVVQLLDRNRQLARQLLSLQEDERASLARELHDEFGQRCTAIRIEAALIASAVPGGQAEAAGRIDAQARALHALVRGLLQRLRPAQLDELGLVDALQALCESWETSSGVACVLHHEGRFDDLPDAASVAVYRIAQEALSNVMRHAGARTVRVQVARAADAALSLQVRDDGVGMAAPQSQSQSQATRPGARGLGLLGAAERAAALGGTLRVDSAPGQGTTLRLSLPASRPQPLPTPGGPA